MAPLWPALAREDGTCTDATSPSDMGVAVWEGSWWWCTLLAGVPAVGVATVCATGVAIGTPWGAAATEATTGDSIRAAMGAVCEGSCWWWWWCWCAVGCAGVWAPAAVVAAGDITAIGDATAAAAVAAGDAVVRSVAAPAAGCTAWGAV